MKINKNKLMINGKEITLTDEQMIELGLKEKDNPFEFIDDGIYYYIASDGKVYYESSFLYNPLLSKVGNYCRDLKLIQQRAWHETLNRLLWRFAEENNDKNIDWTDISQQKYYIEKWYDEFSISSNCEYKYQGTIYFSSEELAQQAIDEIIEPFIEEYKDFVW